MSPHPAGGAAPARPGDLLARAAANPAAHDAPVGDLVVDGAAAQDPPLGDAETARRVWAALVPALAGRRRVRESRDGGRSYQARWERPLTDRLPSVPAAVPVYGSDGLAHTLVIDLDVKKGGSRAAVLRDAAAITALVTRCGGRLIADESASGGIHLYVPLTAGVPFHEARDTALALAAATPSMDPAPNTNLLHGLIRPPGSRHKTGGFQTLRGSLDEAVEVAMAGNPPPVWSRLVSELAPRAAALAARRVEVAALTEGAATEPAVARRGGPRNLAADYLTIATAGTFDDTRYASPSEARQAVVTAACWAGHSLATIAARIERGAWPGLAALYARYRPATRRAALTRDWTKAKTLVEKHRSDATRGKLVHKSHTSAPTSHRPCPPPTQPGTESNRGSAGEYRFLRTWWSALRLTEHDRYTGRSGPALRMVLRALGEAGMKTGSRYVAFGVRSLAVATGLDPSTVAAHLRQLRDEPDPLIDLIEGDRGLAGDLYELRMSDAVAARAEHIDLPAGKIQALRPVFRALGIGAAFVYEALEATRRPAASFDVAAATRIGRSSVYEALATLAAYGLVEKRSGRWTVTPDADLTALAESLGCVTDIDLQLAHYRVERAAWRALHGATNRLTETVTGDDSMSWLPWPDPPPDTLDTVIDLLQARLGARVLT